MSQRTTVISGSAQIALNRMFGEALWTECRMALVRSYAVALQWVASMPSCSMRVPNVEPIEAFIIYVVPVPYARVAVVVVRW